MYILTTEIELKIGAIYPCVDHNTGGEANLKVIREATKEEYLAQDDLPAPNPQTYFYLVHID